MCARIWTIFLDPVSPCPSARGALAHPPLRLAAPAAYQVPQRPTSSGIFWRTRALSPPPRLQSKGNSGDIRPRPPRPAPPSTAFPDSGVRGLRAEATQSTLQGRLQLEREAMRHACGLWPGGHDAIMPPPSLHSSSSDDTATPAIHSTRGRHERAVSVQDLSGPSGRTRTRNQPACARMRLRLNATRPELANGGAATIDDVRRPRTLALDEDRSVLPIELHMLC